jgi:His/Glu/Gln/Arg/opine family amino acid ABC transporter permease subunit
VVPQHWILARYLPVFLEGALVTVELALSAIAIVIVWGLVVAAARLSRLPGLALLAGGYIQLMRNTPLLVQIYFIYFGLAMAGFALSGFASGLLALCLQNGAYAAEIYRGGLQSLSVKQIEGGRALGMTPWLTFRIVVLPQAVARVIPALGNQFVLILKDTSIVSAIAVGELMHVGKLLSERTAATYEIFLVLAVFYLVMTSIVTTLVRLYERRVAFLL